MTKPTILVTRRLPVAVEQRLQQDYTAWLNPSDQPYSSAELIAKSQGADALLISLTDRLTADLIQQLPTSVKAIATFSVGYDHIDLAAAHQRQLAVIYTPGVLTEATADATLLLLLGAARRASEGEQLLRSGNWQGIRPTELLGTEVHGKRLGIYGMGRIGQAVAQRARGFMMEIHYHNRHRLPPEREQGAVFHEQVEDLLRVSDFLSLHCPSTPETEGFLNASRIALLPDRAIVINAARGTLIVEDDLIAALRSGKIAAVGLDVYQNEPHVNPALRSLPNTFLLPHLGSATVETRTAMGMLLIDNLNALFAGKQPLNLVKIG
ncbi:D-glycerate dehydrogenase [Kovacikia minuta CCNUW1]|uniref:2-hydroxyacid dehydrogenase n=1 Tax=Kovacikia minuta TaxID=2931930 RepID=UPI001CCF4C0E|nr:D-glycerate dehydrogenase [Kovacikia minuta]UBF29150.1 D-glycerate dehydrogenase [Kovacikia minuta CCNUW1]